MKNLKNIIASIILIVISFVSYTQDTQDTLKYEFYLTDTTDIENVIVDTVPITNTMGNNITNISEDILDLGELNSNMIFTTDSSTHRIFLFNEDQYNDYVSDNTTTAGVISSIYDLEDQPLVAVYDNIDSLIPNLIKDTTIFYILIETINVGVQEILNTKIKYSVAEDNTEGTASIDTEVIEVSNTRVYPNPVMNSLNIEFETINTDTEVEIYSTNGQLMYKDVEYRNFGVNKVSVDMSNYPSGMYIVRLGNEVKKVIKQ